MAGSSTRIDPLGRISNLKRRVERKRTIMNFLAAYRRPSLILLISTFSAVTCASAGAQPRIPKAHSRTTLRPGLIRLDSSTTILVSAEEGEPIQQAAADLAHDFHSVTGERARIVHDGNDASAVTLWIASPAKLPPSIDRPRESSPESFSLSVTSLSVTSLPGPRPRQAILLTGADVRGTIYAVYQFSQEFLGVDPLYLLDRSRAPASHHHRNFRRAEPKFPRPRLRLSRFLHQ
ncbi:MAG TPA: hypothetical protein VGI47_11800 [Candidatus Binataceae bacterium]